MQYKPIAQTDYADMLATEAYAFGGDLAQAEQYINSTPPNTYRGWYVDGELVSQMQILPLTVGTGHEDVALGGVASVATPPEHRRRGYVDHMLLAACNEMRERDMALCMLHPFKTSFYRKFGWGTCQERRNYSGSPALFASFLKNQHGQFTSASETQIEELNSIYMRAFRGRFGPIVRDEAWWRNHVLSDGKKPFHASIWRDEQGRGRSYVVYRLEQRAEGDLLRIREIAALDPEARAQLFVFIANHDSQANKASFTAPTDAPVNMLLPDPLHCVAEPYFMLRLVDVEQALRQYKYAHGVSGALTIAVSDDWLAYNQGVYRIELNNGNATVTRSGSDSADLTVDVAVLAQLYARYLRPRTAAAFGLLAVHDRSALTLADATFAGLAPFSSDFF